MLDNLDLYGSAFLETVRLFLIAAIGSLVVGTVLAGQAASPVPVLRGFSATYVNVFRPRSC